MSDYCEKLLKVEVKDEDVKEEKFEVKEEPVDVKEEVKEEVIKSEIKEEVLEVSEDNKLTENIDNAVRTGHLGLAGMC